jgi:predicted amidohydrolase
LAEKAADASQKKVYNTSCIIERDGAIAAIYRKLHLFNLFAPNGDKLYCESDGYLSGRELVACKVDGLNVGMSICYDLRFPELYLELQRRFGFLDVILVPAAFTLGTGMYHWEPLLKARAIEHQSFVIASNQVGTHAPGKSSYGHSMIIDPWGDVLASTGSEPGIAFAELNPARIPAVRARVPSLANKRPELTAQHDRKQQ